ncbi:MAG: arylsulfatase [Prosthecobacter sp.]|nr:arylsulfatase [Prosthecobacter sp.]
MKPLHQLLLILGTLSLTITAPLHAAEKKLNVVFILADDLGWGELGSFGQTKIPTPNLDQLAQEGSRFTRHYSGAPVCAPARCVLMTGKHLGHAEIRGNLQAKKSFPQFDEGQYPISESALTMAQVFQKAGYATGAMGKWGLGPVGSTGEPNKKGFDLFFGYNCQAVAHSYYPPYVWRNTEKIIINKNPIPGHAKQPEGEVKMDDWIGETYAPKLMIEEAEGFIQQHAAEPFFLYLAFIEPHVSMHPPRASVERFPEAWDTEPYRGENGYVPHPRPHAAYAAMISDLDGYVGHVMATLKKQGLEDNTLIIFTSDNGTTHPRLASSHFNVGGVDATFFNSTAGLRGFKGSVYEGGIRIPMIARLPGRIPAGAVNETPGFFADWFPTLCEATGVTAPAGLDGQSLWPALTSGKFQERTKPLLWVFPEYEGQVAVRLGGMKVVRQKLKTKKPGPWELYDLTNDPTESQDIAAQHPEIIQQAVDLLKKEVSENPIFPLAIPGVNAPGV